MAKDDFNNAADDTLHKLSEEVEDKAQKAADKAREAKEELKGELSYKKDNADAEIDHK